MLTTQDFVKEYEKLNDIELYQMHLNKDDYSSEGQEALFIVMESRGGLQQVETAFMQRQIRAREKARVRKEVAQLAVSGSHPQFLYKLITSDILSTEELYALIDQSFNEVKLEEKDVKVTSRTIYGSILGGGIGAVIGGIIWGLQLIQMNRMFVLLGFGLYLLSYGLIRLFTKQSKNNTIVLIASLLSVGIAIMIGFILYDLFGQRTTI